MLEIAWWIILAVIWLIVIFIIIDQISYNSQKRKEEREYEYERERKIKEQEKRLIDKWEL